VLKGIILTPNALETTSKTALSDGDLRTKNGRFYLPELDCLRLFAFVMVFLAHSGPKPGTITGGKLSQWIASAGSIVSTTGNLGVFVFFMLSSYLITALLLKELRKTNSIEMKSFYIRRVLRIWPLYLVFLAVSVVVGLFLSYYRVPVGQLVAMVLVSGNWYFGLHGWGTTFASPLWSISVEEQFYLIWPALLKFGGKKIMRAGCLALMALGFLTLAIEGLTGANAVPSIWTNSLVLFQFFALGGLIAFALEGKTLRYGALMRTVLICVGIFLFVLSVTVFDIHANRGAIGATKLICGYSCVDLGCAAVFFSFFGAAIPSSLSFFVYLGRISYGLYVFHEMSLDLSRWILTVAIHRPHSPLKLPLGLMLTIGFAAVSYRLIETPFLRLKDKFALVKSCRI